MISEPQIGTKNQVAEQAERNSAPPVSCTEALRKAVSARGKSRKSERISHNNLVHALKPEKVHPYEYTHRARSV
jgi:hypothetical protein